MIQQFYKRHHVLKKKINWVPFSHFHPACLQMASTVQAIYPVKK